MRARPIESEAHRGESRRQELIARVTALIEKLGDDAGPLYSAANTEANIHAEAGLGITNFQLAVRTHAAKIRSLERVLLKLKSNLYSEHEVLEAIRAAEPGSA